MPQRPFFQSLAHSFQKTAYLLENKRRMPVAQSYCFHALAHSLLTQSLQTLNFQQFTQNSGGVCTPTIPNWDFARSSRRSPSERTKAADGKRIGGLRPRVAGSPLPAYAEATSGRRKPRGHWAWDTGTRTIGRCRAKDPGATFRPNATKRMAPRAGLEPATFRLTAERSTVELPGNRPRGGKIEAPPRKV